MEFQKVLTNYSTLLWCRPVRVFLSPSQPTNLWPRWNCDHVFATGLHNFFCPIKTVLLSWLKKYYIFFIKKKLVTLKTLVIYSFRKSHLYWRSLCSLLKLTRLRFFLTNKLTHGTEWKSTNCRLCLRNDEAGVISGGGDECKEDEYWFRM